MSFVEQQFSPTYLYERLSKFVDKFAACNAVLFVSPFFQQGVDGFFSAFAENIVFIKVDVVQAFIFCDHKKILLGEDCGIFIALFAADCIECFFVGL